MTKPERYQRIRAQLEEMLTRTDDPIARMATIVAVLHHKMPGFSWTGFYRLLDGELTVGPYQGLVACQVLEPHQGVCWAVVERGASLVVEDVHAFPGHIDCDPRSRSEIAVPVRDASGAVVAILDVDALRPAHFDDQDRAGLEQLAGLVLAPAR
jgi:L-methionine (R)-S-oxide reductase